MPETLIKGIARDFSEGKLERVAAAFAIPGVVHVGDKILSLATENVMLDALRAYRSNLMVESYDHTDIEIEHRTDAPDGRVQLLVTWTNFNDRGAVISAVHAGYIWKQDPAGEWKIIGHEILPPWKERLSQGIPLM
ncbi:hypothetical protein [Gymnodinialimonas sp.]